MLVLTVVDPLADHAVTVLVQTASSESTPLQEFCRNIVCDIYLSEISRFAISARAFRSSLLFACRNIPLRYRNRGSEFRRYVPASSSLHHLW